jgi:hypothetical protein
MSLESILKPVKWVDKSIQRQYTKLAQRIPEEHLYKITMGAQLVGSLGPAVWLSQYFRAEPLIVQIGFGAVLGAPDFRLNHEGLLGRIRKESDGEALSVEIDQTFCEGYNRAIRVPIFLTGVGFLGKAVYDVANYFMNSEPLTIDIAQNAATGLGFLCCASSMYLKDQDPKLLERKPSGVKEFFEGLYEKVKGLVPSSGPAPQPVPVRECLRIDNYVC